MKNNNSITADEENLRMVLTDYIDIYKDVYFIREEDFSCLFGESIDKKLTLNNLKMLYQSSLDFLRKLGKNTSSYSDNLEDYIK